MKGLISIACAVLMLVLGLALVHPSSQAADAITPAEEQAVRIMADRQPATSLAPQAATPCVDGMAGIYPCHNINLLSTLPLGSIGGGEGADIWGWTDSLTNKEYALVATQNGTAFVDVSDPVNPIYLGILPKHNSTPSFWDTWRDVKVYENHAYIVSENRSHGMQVFDLTQLRSVASPPTTFSNTAHYGAFTNGHNIFINEQSGYGYVVGATFSGTTCNGGLHMINLSNPTAPTFAGCFSADGYTHDVQCVNYFGPDTTYSRQEICFASNVNTLTIVDVTDKSNPVQLARQTYTGASYAHQGWLTDDQRYFLMDDETDERSNGHNTRTYIWDVQDLDNPMMIGTHDGPTSAIDHNQYIKRNLAYQANYEAGVRILSTYSITHGSLNEIAYFDTYPSGNTNQFNGAWSIYPFFASGTLVASDINSGLYVLCQNSIEPLYPHHLTRTTELTPTFQWALPGDNTYTIEVATDNSFADIVVSQTVTTTSYTPTTALSADVSNHYWRVTSSNSCGTVVSSTQSFYIINFKNFIPILIR